MLKIGEKEYEFKRPSLKLLKEVIKAEQDLDALKIMDVLSDDATTQAFSEAWKRYCQLVFQNPGDLANAEELTFEEIGKIRQGFLAVAAGPTLMPAVTLQTSPASK